MTGIQHFQIAAFLTFVVNILLILFVVRRAPPSRITRRFLWYGTSIAIWSFFLGLFSSINNQNLSYLFCQALHVGAIFIPCFFLHFLHEYLDLNNTKANRILKGAYLVSAFFLLLDLFSPRLFISKVVPKLGFPFFMNGGPAYPYWIFVFFAIVIHGHILLYQGVCYADGQLRKQRKIFLISNLVGYIGGVGVFFPVYDITLFPFPYGAYGVTLFSIMTVYASVRFRFMDIQVIIRKTVIFAGLSSFVLGIFALMTFLVRNVLNAYIFVGSTATNLISIMLVVLCYDRLREFLVNVTDRYLFQKKINYRTLLKEASQQMASIKSLKRLARVIVGFLIKKARISRAVLFVCADENSHFVLLASRPVTRNPSQKVLSGEHPLIQYLKVKRQPLEIIEIENLVRAANHLEKQHNFEAFLKLLKDFNAHAVIPSFLSTASGERKEEFQLRSILFLGPQKSDEPYSQEDLDVFFTLAQESAIAIENARLYDEAIQRTRILAETNKELADTNEKLKVTQTSLIVAEKNATMVNIAKAIGHEINNPLSSVIMPIERIYRTQVPKCRDAFEKILAHIPPDHQEQTKESQEIVNKVLTDIHNATIRADRSANRISAVVHTLTDILKDSKGEMGSLSLVVLCREAVEASRFSTSDLVGRDIKQNIQTNLMIRGNLNQLLQVFINLIKNAFEAMDKQKERSVVINADYDPANSDMALIEFVDNGPGIPPEILPKIWMQGFSTKGKKDDSIGAAGQGQGLFVCKHVIESIHKGSINAESAAGKGTKFTIRLPLAELKENA